jgi:putative membrane protein
MPSEPGRLLSGAPSRLHPLAPVFDLAGQARQLVAPLIAAAVGGGLPFVVLVLGGVLAFRGVAWLRRTYSFDGTVLRVDEGVLSRNQRMVPCDRIQQVALVQKLRHRAVGLAGLRVETAGSAGGSEVHLDPIGLEEARRLRSALLAAKAAAPGTQGVPGPGPVTQVPGLQGSDAITPAPGPVAPPGPAPEILLRLSVGRLALAGVTGAQLAVMLAVGLWGLRILDDLPGRAMERLDPEALLPTTELAAAFSVLVLVALWLGLAAAASIVTDAGYTLTRVGDELHARRGLFETRESVVPLARVQVVRIQQSPLRRALNLAAVRVQSAGGAGEDTRISVPLVTPTELEHLLHRVLPGAAPLPGLQRPPVAALRRAIVRRAVPAALVLLPLAWLQRPLGLAWLLLLPLAVLWGVAAYRGLGHGWRDHHLVARSGALFRETAVVSTGKAQSARLHASWFQRRQGLATVHVDVAGGAAPSVIDEAVGVGDGIMRRVVGRAAA